MLRDRSPDEAKASRGASRPRMMGIVVRICLLDKDRRADVWGLWAKACNGLGFTTNLVCMEGSLESKEYRQDEL